MVEPAECASSHSFTDYLENSRDYAELATFGMMRANTLLLLQILWRHPYYTYKRPPKKTFGTLYLSRRHREERYARPVAVPETARDGKVARKKEGVMNSYGSEGPRKWTSKLMLDEANHSPLVRLQWMRTCANMGIDSTEMGNGPNTNTCRNPCELAPVYRGRTRHVCVCSDEETRPAKKRRRQTSEDSARDRDLRSRSPVTLKSNDGLWWVVDGHRFVSSRRTFKRRSVRSISLPTPSPLSPPALSPTSVVDTPTASYSPTEVGNTPSPSTLIPPATTAATTSAAAAAALSRGQLSDRNADTNTMSDIAHHRLRR